MSVFKLSNQLRDWQKLMNLRPTHFQTSLKVKTENEIQIKIAKTLMQQDLSKLTKT